MCVVGVGCVVVEVVGSVGVLVLLGYVECGSG